MKKKWNYWEINLIIATAVEKISQNETLQGFKTKTNYEFFWQITIKEKPTDTWRKILIKLFDYYPIIDDIQTKILISIESHLDLM